MYCIVVFSIVLENTAFLGDLVLRLPDISHSLLDSNSEWASVLQWAVSFCNDTNVFVDIDATHLSLVCILMLVQFSRDALVLDYFDVGLFEQLCQSKKHLCCCDMSFTLALHYINFMLSL